MTSQYNFKLVDNTYKADAGADILLTFLEGKIKFLNQQISKLNDPIGEEASHLEKRLTELKDTKRYLVSMTQSAKQGNFDLEIDCIVNIKFKQKIEGNSEKL